MLYVGTSGYSFREWVGPFYPPKMPNNKFLAFYSSRLNTVEINYTFRQFPNERLLASWADQTPDTFRFSLKMHQSITHRSRLKGVNAPVGDFMRALEALGSRLGVTLFQLPPFFPFDSERLEEVLTGLPKEKKFAFEFRNPSWENPQTLDLLRHAGIALCETGVVVSKASISPTARYAYMRVREVPPFSAEELARMRRHIRQVLEEVEDLFLYIKHDEAGLSPKVALDLQEEFGSSAGKS